MRWQKFQRERREDGARAGERKKFSRKLGELLAVLGITAAVFCLGASQARSCRDGDARGGEYALLLIPAVYYAGKRTVSDWIAELREYMDEWGVE